MSDKPPRTDPAAPPFLWLLIALVVTMLLAPLTDDTTIGGLLMYSCFTLVFVTGAWANRQRRWFFHAAVFLAVIGVPLIWSQLVIGTTVLDMPRLVVDIVFFGFTAMMILVAVVMDHMATRQAVFGAICVYLLLGMTWALVYTMIEYLDADAFWFADRQTDTAMIAGREMTSWAQMVYYSFVTMTTLGFGDVAPRSPAAQTATWMQAVAGQLFLAILIARAVSELPSLRDRR